MPKSQINHHPAEVIADTVEAATRQTFILLSGLIPAACKFFKDFVTTLISFNSLLASIPRFMVSLYKTSPCLAPIYNRCVQKTFSEQSI